MTVARECIFWEDNFDRAQALTTTPGMNGWTVKDTSSAGTPTYLTVTEDGGAMKLLFDNTSEAQIVTMYQNDVLMWDLALLQWVEWTFKVGGFDSVTEAVLGVADAQNNTLDSVATNCWFKVTGATPALFAESDDGTTDTDDKSAGGVTGSGYNRCAIDFTKGLSDIRFFTNGQRVASGTTFTLASITAGQNVQPFVQIQKASGTGVGFVQIKRVKAQFAIAAATA